MIIAIPVVLRRCCSSIPNLLVLAVLTGIGYWGHTTHWKMPKFSELFGAPPAVILAPVRPARSEAKPFGTSSGKPGTGDERSGKGPSGEERSGEPTDAEASAPAAPLPSIRLPSVEAIEKAGIVVGAVQQRRMDEFVTAYGTVGYDEAHLAQLSCRVSGIVWRVLKKLGEPVQKGDILAILDSAEVGQAKAEFLDADVEYDLKIQNLNRLKQVSGSIPERQMREAEAEVRKSSVRRFNTQQTLINLGLPISVKRTAGMTDDELARQIHFLGLPPEIVSSLDAETASANLIPLVSPLDGIVIKREVVTGEVVEPTRTQFVVADVRRMWLILNVRKVDAANLAIGQDILFTFPGLPDEIPSKLSWIATEVDLKTRNVQVRAEVENRIAAGSSQQDTGQWLLRANMFGTGRVRIRRRPSVLVVPSTAVQWDGTQHLVFVPQEDGLTFQPHHVELGATHEGFTEVRRGLKLGQPVVSAGSYILKSELAGIDQ